MSRRAIVGRIVLVLLGLGAGLVVIGALEWGVRSQLGIYRCDEELGWTFRPASNGIKLNRHGEFAERVTMNAQGFRDDEPRAAGPGLYRILLLGDSIAASLQVPKPATFDAIVEKRLDARAASGRRIEIINTGVDGYGSAQELLLLRRQGLSYGPDAILLQVYITNDLPDNHHAAGNWNHYLAIRCGRPYFQLTDGGVSQRSKPVPPQTSGWGHLLRYSQLYSAIIAPPTPPGTGPAFRIQDVNAEDPPPILEEAWELTQQLILTIGEEARTRGIPFFVMVAPAKQAVGQLSPDRAAGEASLERWRRAHDRLVTFLDDREIPHIELLPALRRQLLEGEEKPYFKIDSHWTVEGHRAVADALFEWLEAHCADLGMPLKSCGDGS